MVDTRDELPAPEKERTNRELHPQLKLEDPRCTRFSNFGLALKRGQVTSLKSGHICMFVRLYSRFNIRATHAKITSQEVCTNDFAMLQRNERAFKNPHEKGKSTD